MAFEDMVFIVGIVILTMNGFILMGSQYLQDPSITNKSYVNSNLPKELNTYGCSSSNTTDCVQGINGTLDINQNANSTGSSQNNALQIPFLQETQSWASSLLGFIYSFFTGYDVVFRAMGLPDTMRFIIAIPITLLQVVGIAMLMRLLVASLPIIGSG